MTIQVITCEVCRIGHCQPTKAPYMYWVADRVLVLPGAPALSCDICGHLYYDPAFMRWMEQLLQELERSVQTSEVVNRRLPADELVSWQSTRGS